MEVIELKRRTPLCYDYDKFVFKVGRKEYTREYGDRYTDHEAKVLLKMELLKRFSDKQT